MDDDVKVLQKFKLSLPLKAGCYVAAASFEDAICAYFPRAQVRLVREGRGWHQYDVGEELEPTWPEANEEDIPGKGGRIVDVEAHGEIRVVMEEDDPT